MKPLSKKRVILLSGTLAVLGLGLAGWRLVMPGALFLSRFMDGARADDPFADITREDVIVDPSGRALRCHVYRPPGRYDKVLLVVHGVHHGGYDEARMVRFAKELACLGFLVVTPEIVDLKQYNISEQAVDDIHIAAKWVLESSTLVEGDESVSLLGFSFAGGLSISAAARPDVRDRVGAVFSFGGHADLDRVMRFLTTGELPGGGTLAPHVYGQVVIARQLASRLVPSAQVEPLRAVLLDYLKNDFKKVKAERESLAAESGRIVDLCLERDTETLGRLLEPLVTARHSGDSLSPIRGAVPSADLYLLHGSVDNVIPPSETVALSEWASGRTATRTLITGLINHVELEADDERSAEEYWEIIRFWTELLRR